MRRIGHYLTWIIIGAVLLPVLYLLSFIPLAWALNHELIPASLPAWAERSLEAYVTPALYALNEGPPWVRGPLNTYADFLVGL